MIDFLAGLGAGVWALIGIIAYIFLLVWIFIFRCKCRKGSGGCGCNGGVNKRPVVVAPTPEKQPAKAPEKSPEKPAPVKPTPEKVAEKAEPQATTQKQEPPKPTPAEKPETQKPVPKKPTAKKPATKKPSSTSKPTPKMATTTPTERKPRLAPVPVVVGESKAVEITPSHTVEVVATKQVVERSVTSQHDKAVTTRNTTELLTEQQTLKREYDTLIKKLADSRVEETRIAERSADTRGYYSDAGTFTKTGSAPAPQSTYQGPKPKYDEEEVKKALFGLKSAMDELQKEIDHQDK